MHLDADDVCLLAMPVLVDMRVTPIVRNASLASVHMHQCQRMAAVVMLAMV